MGSWVSGVGISGTVCRMVFTVYGFSFAVNELRRTCWGICFVMGGRGDGHGVMVLGPRGFRIQ